MSEFKTRPPQPMKLPKKADNREVTPEFLIEREKFAKSLGYQKQKWVEFCEVMLKRGYRVTLYEAKQTRSKYLTVHKEQRRFKVRFSDHAPILRRELAADCDFFVGKTNMVWTTTQQAIDATIRFFEGRKRPKE